MRNSTFTLNLIVLILVSSFFNHFTSGADISEKFGKRWSTSNTYHALVLGAKYLWACYEWDQPWRIEVAWWGTMAAEDGGFIDTIGSGRNACQICLNKKEDPETDCFTAVSEVLKMSIMNAVKISIGWRAQSVVNAAIDNTSDQPLKRSTMPYPCDDGWCLDSDNVTYSTPDLYTHAEQLYAGTDVVILTPESLTRRDSTGLETVTVMNITSGLTVDINHRIDHTGCGTVFVGPPSTIAGVNMTLTKRRDDPHEFPFCDGFIGVDYCSNHNSLGGIYGSGELDTMAHDLAYADSNGNNYVDFYKMYWVKDSGNEDWLTSFRTYYTNAPSSAIHWSQCDTGA
uniref:Killer toxin n=1 Tax=Saccharomyces paradoxus virus M1L TaxID=2805738 RepID=A0A7U0R264_9VIRU|nr:killer toxin [Saccharomyces paradoxus virus M1L]